MSASDSQAVPRVGACLSARHLAFVPDTLWEQGVIDHVDLSVLDGGARDGLRYDWQEHGVTCGLFRLLAAPPLRVADLREWAMREWLTIIELAVDLHVTVVTFGSGDFRRGIWMTCEGDAERARHESRELCCAFAEEAHRFGISFLVEPLDAQESPFWNSLQEVADDLQGQPDIGLVADVAHTWFEYCSEVTARVAIQRVHTVHLSGRGRSIPSTACIGDLVGQLSSRSADLVLWECDWRSDQDLLNVIRQTRESLNAR